MIGIYGSGGAGDGGDSAGDGVDAGVGMVSIGAGFGIGVGASASGKSTGAQAISSIWKVIIITVNRFFICIVHLINKKAVKTPLIYYYD